MQEENKKPQTTHGSEQFEGKELIEIASSLLSDYNNQTVENLPEYSSRLIRYVNNLWFGVNSLLHGLYSA